MNKTTINIEILGKTYPIKCPEHEVESLQKAAKLLEEKMNHTKETAHLLSHDRIAVITSLNLAHQIMLLEQHTHQYMQSIHHKLQNLQTKIDSALARDAQMELASAE